MAIEETLKRTESETACTDPIDRMMLDSFYDAFHDLTLPAADNYLKANPELVDKMQMIADNPEMRTAYSEHIMDYLGRITEKVAESRTVEETEQGNRGRDVTDIVMADTLYDILGTVPPREADKLLKDPDIAKQLDMVTSSPNVRADYPEGRRELLEDIKKLPLL